MGKPLKILVDTVFAGLLILAPLVALVCYPDVLANSLLTLFAFAVIYDLQRRARDNAFGR